MPVPVSPICARPPEPPCAILNEPIFPLQPEQPTEDVVPIELLSYPPHHTVPAGTIMGTRLTTTPPLCLVCDGSEYSRTTYATLFAVIGTYYGEGDESTTFNVPHLTNDASADMIYLISYEEIVVTPPGPPPGPPPYPPYPPGPYPPPPPGPYGPYGPYAPPYHYP